MTPDGVAPGGAEPHDPGMEMRVSRLEEDMRDVKATLGRLEPGLIRIDAQLQATLHRVSNRGRPDPLNRSSRTSGALWWAPLVVLEAALVGAFTGWMTWP